MKFFFTGNTETLREGLRLLADAGEIELGEGGLPVEVRLDEKAPATLCIHLADGKASLTVQDKPAFFRSVAILNAHAADKTFDLCETRSFDRNGIMFDCSRNAVVKPERLRYLLRKMALMGHSWAMMYTEETYELPSEPYFGYCRGRYTYDELKALDDYAYALGIELVPCIQTLSHLERFLQWNAVEAYRDTAKTLFVGDEAVYDLIERMLVAASSPYRSKRIHIGMDEAWDLGRGKRIDKRGYTPPTAIMAEHLAKVRTIIQKLGLQAMMWSDMHFENAGPGGYFSPGKVFTEEIIRSAPEEIDLVYWDYYHENEDGYERMLRDHELFRSKTIFAGGIWTWSGIAPDYRKTLTVLKPGLQKCIEHGIREVFATAWGDDGGECPQSATLLGLQYYAEMDYAHTCDDAAVARRFAECVHADAALFLNATKLQYPYILPKPELGVLNAAKIFLYEDPLMPLYEADLSNEGTVAHYQSLAEQLKRNASDAPAELKAFAQFYAALAEVLALKCEWRSKAASIVRSKDRKAAGALIPLAKANEEALDRLGEVWHKLWMSENKPQGFEVADGRIGWTMARFHTAAERMSAFADGSLEDIPELSETKLHRCIRKDGLYWYNVGWHTIVSPSIV